MKNIKNSFTIFIIISIQIQLFLFQIHSNFFIIALEGSEHLNSDIYAFKRQAQAPASCQIRSTRYGQIHPTTAPQCLTLYYQPSLIVTFPFLPSRSFRQ